jgi:regulator of nucleoside diphosphate kinase
MNAFISTLLVLGLYLAGVLLVLFVGRLIIGTDFYRRWAEKRGKHYPRSRIIEDLRPVQQTMIEFIDASPPSRELLQRLAETDEPIPVRNLLASVPAGESSWLALFLIAAAGLISFGRQGILVTDAGREVLARLSGGTTELADKTTEGKNGSEGMSHLKVLNETFDRKERPWSESALTGRSFRVGQLPAQLGTPLRNDVEDKSPAIVTAADHRELSAAVVAAKKLAAHEGETQVLQEKLAHAVISPAVQIPPDVITMYTRAELLDIETNEQLNLMLVFPIDANLEQGRISVFHPLGAAMLGRRVGHRFDWTVPYGVQHFEVRAVHFQPEAAFAKAA